jgi:hypothetical protein
MTASEKTFAELRDEFWAAVNQFVVSIRGRPRCHCRSCKAGEVKNIEELRDVIFKWIEVDFGSQFNLYHRRETAEKYADVVDRWIWDNIELIGEFFLQAKERGL